MRGEKRAKAKERMLRCFDNSASDLDLSGLGLERLPEEIENLTQHDRLDVPNIEMACKAQRILQEGSGHDQNNKFLINRSPAYNLKKQGKKKNEVDYASNPGEASSSTKANTQKKTYAEGTTSARTSGVSEPKDQTKKITMDNITMDTIRNLIEKKDNEANEKLLRKVLELAEEALSLTKDSPGLFNEKTLNCLMRKGGHTARIAGRVWLAVINDLVAETSPAEQSKALAGTRASLIINLYIADAIHDVDEKRKTKKELMHDMSCILEGLADRGILISPIFSYRHAEIGFVRRNANKFTLAVLNSQKDLPGHLHPSIETGKGDSPKYGRPFILAGIGLKEIINTMNLLNLKSLPEYAGRLKNNYFHDEVLHEAKRFSGGKVPTDLLTSNLFEIAQSGGTCPFECFKGMFPYLGLTEVTINVLVGMINKILEEKFPGAKIPYWGRKSVSKGNEEKVKNFPALFKKGICTRKLSYLILDELPKNKKLTFPVIRDAAILILYMVINEINNGANQIDEYSKKQIIDKLSYASQQYNVNPKCPSKTQAEGVLSQIYKEGYALAPAKYDVFEFRRDNGWKNWLQDKKIRVTRYTKMGTELVKAEVPEGKFSDAYIKEIIIAIKDELKDEITEEKQSLLNDFRRHLAEPSVPNLVKKEVPGRLPAGDMGVWPLLLNGILPEYGILPESGFNLPRIIESIVVKAYKDLMAQEELSRDVETPDNSEQLEVRRKKIIINLEKVKKGNYRDIIDKIKNNGKASV
jgi:hypothetical protein